MATNTLTGLIPVIYQALDTVVREQVGFIPAVTINADATSAAVGQTIRSPIAPASAAADITPGVTSPDTGAQTIGYADLTISKARAVPVQWSGEEQASVGGQYGGILQEQFAQAFRVLSNEVEADIAALYNKASRAYGTAGTAPFGTASDLSDFAQIRKILEDNGVPPSDLQLVLGSAAIANLRGKQSVLFKANEAGTTDLLRLGAIGVVEGLQVHNSAQVKNHTKGTGASYVLNGVQAVGATSIVVKTGTGTIVAGDVLSFQNDTNKYVTTTGIAAPGTAVIGAPGKLIAGADGETVTLSNNYAANMAFHRSAIQLIARAPAMPSGGDAASDVILVTDPVSGLTFQVALYKQYRRIHIEVGLAWGVGVVKPEFLAILQG